MEFKSVSWHGLHSWLRPHAGPNIMQSVCRSCAGWKAIPCNLHKEEIMQLCFWSLSLWKCVSVAQTRLCVCVVRSGQGRVLAHESSSPGPIHSVRCNGELRKPLDSLWFYLTPHQFGAQNTLRQWNCGLSLSRIDNKLEIFCSFESRNAMIQNIVSVWTGCQPKTVAKILPCSPLVMAVCEMNTHWAAIPTTTVTGRGFSTTHLFAGNLEQQLIAMSVSGDAQGWFPVWGRVTNNEQHWVDVKCRHCFSCRGNDTWLMMRPAMSQPISKSWMFVLNLSISSCVFLRIVFTLRLSVKL